MIAPITIHRRVPSLSSLHRRLAMSSSNQPPRGTVRSRPATVEKVTATTTPGWPSCRTRSVPRIVLLDPDVTAAYARDQAMLAPAGTPAAVVFAAHHRRGRRGHAGGDPAGVPIVPRGAGSGLTGAGNAVDGAVTVVMTKMNRILEIDEGHRLAVVQPGVVNLTFRDAVAGSGLFYAPDPSSYDWCTIGGNLSTNAGGLCCVKYGVTTDSVLGLEVVLASGGCCAPAGAPSRASPATT